MNDTSNTDSGVVKWRNRKTGTVYASVEFNGTPVATVTTEAGSVYNVDVVSLDAFTEPRSKTELDAQLHAILKEVNLNGYYDGMDGTGSGHSMAVAKQALTTLIAQREQAAKLRVRQDERRKARQLYAKRNPQYTRQWIADCLGISRPTLNKWLEDPELFTVGAIRKLSTLQATEPEKEG